MNNPRGTRRRGLWSCALALAALLVSAGAAHGAITYVGTGATSASNGSNRCTPTVPAVNVGDLLVAHVTVRNNRVLTAPAGWSFLWEDLANGDTSQNIYYKLAAAGDSGATLAWSLSASDDNACAIRAYRGVDPAIPIDAYTGTSGTASTTLTAPAITTSVANAWLLTFFGAADSRARPFTIPAGMSERYDFGNTDNNAGIAIAGDDEVRGAAGATGTHTVTSSRSARWVAETIALRPDTTPPAVVSIARAGINPTGAATVSWTVTFSENVVNVQSANFALVTTGLTGTPAITGVTGSGSIWTVTASTGTGSGTLGLNLAATGTIQDLVGLGLSTAVPVVGAVYTVDRTPPSVLSINRAGASPTSAANVTWTVTFSKAVTGVTATNFTLINVGLNGSPAIFDVSGSGAIWSVTATTGDGTATGTLGLNATSSTGVTDSSGNSLTGLPFTGQVYSIGGFTQDCLTDTFSTGTLDTNLWTVRTVSGTYTPAVANAGGGDYRLRLTTPLNNESTFAQLRRTFPGSGNKIVLEIDYFAYGGSNPGADGTAIVLSDSTVSSSTGGYGGSLGYAQNTAATPSANGFGGGWLGVGLDEYGNYPCNNEGRTGYPAGWVDPVLGAVTPCAGGGGNTYYVAVRGSGSGTTGYNLLANTGLLGSVAPASGAANATPYRYRFTVDHSDGVHAWVKVERDTTGTGNSYSTLIPNFDAKASGSGQATVPNRWLLSFTSSTGGATNYHEFKRVRVCANTISTSLVGPDHFEIRHATGTGVTCSPSTVTVVACANASCSSLYTSGTSGTLTATGGATVNGAGTAFAIPNGSSSVNRDIQVTTAGSVVLGVTSSDAANATTCNFGSPSCTFSATDSGFIVTGTNHVAETLSSLTVQAVRKSDNSLACVPAFASTGKTINLKCAYSNPAIGTLPARVNGVALNGSGGAGAACDGTGANVSLTFDATGTATPTLQYADVGQVTVNASYTGTAGAMDSGLTMTGGGAFIARPQRFDFSQIRQAASPYLANPAAADYTGNAFVKAGENFLVLATARNAAGNTTPNYGGESAPESVKLSSTLQDPVGGNAGTLSPVTGHAESFGTTDLLGFAPFGTDCNNAAAAGSACGVFTWSEVGVISLAGRVGDNDYLGTGDVATTAPGSGNVGRFYPASFTVTPTQQPGCAVANAFTYAGHVASLNKKGQPFVLSAVVTPMNMLSSPTPTLNYTAATTGTLSHGYMKLAAGSFTSTANPSAPGSARPLTGATLTIGTDPLAPGRMNFTAAEAYDFNAEQAPQPIAFDVRATDSDGAVGANTTGTVPFRFGRIRLVNANGTGRTTLAVPFQAEYFTAGGYVINPDDGCTALTTTANLLLSNNNWVGSQTGDLPIAVGAGSTQAGIAFPTLSAGRAGLSFTAPNSTGNVDIRTVLTGVGRPNWLLYDWDGNGLYDDEANGRASFGIYSGSPRHIYLREVIQ